MRKTTEGKTKGNRSKHKRAGYHAIGLGPRFARPRPRSNSCRTKRKGKQASEPTSEPELGFILDAVLQYCLGRIYEQSGESSLARESYARSTDLGGPIEAKIRLADLMFEVGQVERSLALYREALNSGLNSS